MGQGHQRKHPTGHPPQAAKRVPVPTRELTLSKRILITGNEGYIGSQMVPVFLESGYEVTGLDTGYFRDCTLTSSSPQVHTLQKDIRDLVPSDLEGFDGVVHLAALSNDPVAT